MRSVLATRGSIAAATAILLAAGCTGDVGPSTDSTETGGGGASSGAPTTGSPDESAGAVVDEGATDAGTGSAGGAGSGP